MTHRYLFFPFTHLTRIQLKTIFSFFPSMESLALEENYQNYPELEALNVQNKIKPWFLTAEESVQTEAHISQYLDWAKIHKGNEHNLKLLFKDNPYFTNDSDISAIKSQLKRSTDDRKEAKSDRNLANQHRLFLKMAQLCDFQNESIDSQLKNIDQNRNKLFSSLRGIEQEKDLDIGMIQPDSIKDDSSIMAKERVAAWSSIMVEKGALSQDGELPFFITTSVAVIEYLESNCDVVINALDLDQIKVHENDCENIKEWRHQLTQVLMDGIEAGRALEKQSFNITDNCRLEGQIKLYLFSGSGINRLFNRSEKQIPVCLVQINNPAASSRGMGL